MFQIKPSAKLGKSTPLAPLFNSSRWHSSKGRFSLHRDHHIWSPSSPPSNKANFMSVAQLLPNLDYLCILFILQLASTVHIWRIDNQHKYANSSNNGAGDIYVFEDREEGEYNGVGSEEIPTISVEQGEFFLWDCPIWQSNLKLPYLAILFIL